MRLYNGCPDAELAAIWKSRADDRNAAAALGYIICYFPIEAKYAAARKSDWLPVGPYCCSTEESLRHVITHSEETKQ